MAITTIFDAVDRGVKREMRDQAKEAARIKTRLTENVREMRRWESAARRAMQQTSSDARRYAEVLRGLRQLQRSGAITQEQAVTTARRFRQELERQNSVMRRLVTQAGAFFSTYQVGLGAVQLVTAEIERQRTISEGALERSQRIALAQRDIVVNLAGQINPDQLRTFSQEITKIAQEASIDVVKTLGEAGAVVSATASDFPERRPLVLQGFREAAELFRGREEDLSEFVGTFLDFSRTAQQAVGLTPTESLALLLQAQSQIRITDIANLPNLVPALAAVDVTSGGQPSRESLIAGVAAFGAIGARLSETRGETTRTTVANLARVLREFFPETPQFADRFQAFLDAPDKLQTEVIDALLGKGATKPVVEELLTALGPAERTFRSIRESFRINPQAVLDTVQLLNQGTDELRTQRQLQSVQNLSAQRIDPELAFVRRILFEGDPSQGVPGVLRGVPGFDPDPGGVRFLIERLIAGPRAAGRAAIGRRLLNEFGVGVTGDLDEIAFPDNAPESARARFDELIGVLRELQPNNNTRPPAIEVGE